jgi:hypothetical protein
MIHLAPLRRALPALALLSAWAFGPAAVAAPNGPIGIVTLIDGSAQIVRETVRFQATEGQRVLAEDLVITAADARLLRVEFSDGNVLDLGPATQAQLQPRPMDERTASVYLAAGWAKLALRPGQTGAGIASARLDLAQLGGTAVMRVDAQQSLVFVESGQADVVEHVQGRPERSVGLRDGESFVLRGSETGHLAVRPSAQLLQGLPRAFADQLPRRAARFQSTQVQPAATVPVSYAEVALWINAEAPLRKAFVQRFAPLAKDRPFRAQLLAELRAHPEWRRVLFPDAARTRSTSVARSHPGRAAPEMTGSPAAAPVQYAPMGGLPLSAAAPEMLAVRAN